MCDLFPFAHVHNHPRGEDAPTGLRACLCAARPLLQHSSGLLNAYYTGTGVHGGRFVPNVKRLGVKLKRGALCNNQVATRCNSVKCVSLHEVAEQHTQQQTRIMHAIVRVCYYASHTVHGTQLSHTTCSCSIRLLGVSRVYQPRHAPSVQLVATLSVTSSPRSAIGRRAVHTCPIDCRRSDVSQHGPVRFLLSGRGRAITTSEQAKYGAAIG